MVKFLRLGLVNILNFNVSLDADVWLRCWTCWLVEILKMKFDQDLCKNLWYELNPRVRCAFGNVLMYNLPTSIIDNEVLYKNLSPQYKSWNWNIAQLKAFQKKW